MEKDDDDKVDVAINVVRYQIMPSLVALQTMRNRLHLAFLGKKLMKWTALATGKELRRLSMEMSGVFLDYGQRIRQAFIMLARCRFHEPMLNVIVLECVSDNAWLTTKMNTRSIAGVKVISIGVEETGKDDYRLLGLGRGGELIQETKRLWYELLKIMILICQFRITFMMVEEANKAATKKQNVLQRVILPKIDMTMRYILSELDEQEREESFRLKRFKQLKHKDDDVKKKVEVEKKEEEVKVKLKLEPKPEPEPKPITPEPVTPEPTEEELIMEHIAEVVRLADIIQNAALISQHFGLTRCDLGKLKLQLHETIKLSQTSKAGRECVKCNPSTCKCPASANQPPKQPCEVKLEVVRPPGYEAALELLPKTKVATPMPEYIMKPKRKQPYIPPPCGIKKDSNERLNDLQNHVDQVICLTHCYKQDGVLSKSAEDFLKCCQNIKTKIDDIKYQRQVNAKIERLKWELNHLEFVTNTVQNEGLTSDSMNNFVSCCKDFKSKLEGRQSSKGAPSVCSIEKLLKRIDVSIELSKAAKMEGLVTESVEEFIETCKDIKAKIDNTQEEEAKPKVINDLRFNLSGIMKTISKYKHDGLLSDSIEKFYTTCESTKAKLDSYKLPPEANINEGQMTIFKQQSRHSDITNNELCPKCQSQRPTPPQKQKGCKAKYYKECPKCFDRPNFDTAPCNSTSQSSVATGKNNKSQKTCTICSQVYTVITKSNHSCKSNYSQPTCSHITLRQPSQVLEKTKCLYCNKDQECPVSMVISPVPEKNKCKKCCDNMDQKDSVSMIATPVPEKVNKCPICNENKDKEGGFISNTMSMMILTKFKNVDGSSIKDLNSVPMKPGSLESVKSTKRVCNAPTTKGFIQIVRNVRSETLIRTQDLSDPYPPCLWSHISADTLTSQDRNNESDSAQLDPFFCSNSSTHDNFGTVLPL